MPARMAQIRAGDLAAAAEERRQLAEVAEHGGLQRSRGVVRAGQGVADRRRQGGRRPDGAGAGRLCRGRATALREAVALQDALPYMEPPYWYYPVRQTLAAVLLEAGQPAQAAQEFQASLIDAPNNAWALFGLMKAQEALNDQAAAKVTQARFEKAWAGGPELPELAQL